MKVVLRTDVDNVGKKGDIVDVADGFGRNYLIPKGQALLASKGIESQASAMRRARDVRDTADREAAEGVARTLVPVVIRITARAGADGRLFGSVTTADIVGAVESQAGVELDRRRLHLDEPIRSLGVHEIPIKLHADVEFVLTLEVVSS